MTSLEQAGEKVYRDKAPLRLLRVLMALGTAGCAFFVVAGVMVGKNKSDPNGLSVTAQCIWIGVVGALMGLTAAVFRGAGRVRLAIGPNAVEVRNSLWTRFVPLPEVAGFVRRGTMGVAVERSNGSRVSVSAINRTHGIDALVDQLNADLAAERRADGSGSNGPRLFRDARRLEALRMCAGVALICGLLLLVIAVVGQSNAHNPDGLSPTVRLVLIGVGLTKVAASIPMLLRSRAYLLIGPSSVDVCNGRGTTTVPVADVVRFEPGDPGRQGATCMVLCCTDGRRVPIVAIGRVDAIQAEQVARELNEAMRGTTLSVGR